VSGYSLVAMLPEGVDRIETVVKPADHAAIGVIVVGIPGDIHVPFTIELQIVAADAFGPFRGSQPILATDASGSRCWRSADS
jgi:hypothetical protein